MKDKKSPPLWTSNHTQIVKKIKNQIKSLSCLHLADPNLPKIVETDASDVEYGGILKQKYGEQEQLVHIT